MKKIKNDLWLLDAHCDSFEMRNFLGTNFDLTQGRYLLSEAIKKFIKQSFKIHFPKNAIHNYQTTLPRLKQGNVKALFLNVADYDLPASIKMIDACYKMAERHSAIMHLCCNNTEIKHAVKTNKIALILLAEGPCVFHGDIELLRLWHSLGIRIVSVSHGEGTLGFPKNAKLVYKNLQSLASTSAWQVSTSTERYLSLALRQKLYQKEKGLSPTGKKMLREIEKLKIICDLSHANDRAFWEVLENTNVKVCVTHSNCAALCNHTRNLTDEMMQALAARDGVMGLCFYGNIIDKKHPSLQRFVEHVLHALTIIGENHVGIGTDFDGVEPDAFMAIPHSGRMNDLWEALDKAGVKYSTVCKIAHENFLRILPNNTYHN